MTDQEMVARIRRIVALAPKYPFPSQVACYFMEERLPPGWYRFVGTVDCHRLTYDGATISLVATSDGFMVVAPHNTKTVSSPSEAVQVADQYSMRYRGWLREEE